MTRILIADDHPLFRVALAQALRGVVADATILEAGSLDEARHVLATQPDVDLVLLDLHMPGSHGLMGLAALRTEYPAVAVVMISANDDAVVVRRALAYGAAGFIGKRVDLDELARALRSVLDCEDYVPESLRREVEARPLARDDRELAEKLASLTPQQFRVLERVAEGRLNKQIADDLGVQERTIKAHLTTIFVKLGVRNRTQAGILLRSLELGDPAQQRLPDAV